MPGVSGIEYPSGKYRGRLQRLLAPGTLSTMPPMRLAAMTPATLATHRENAVARLLRAHRAIDKESCRSMVVAVDRELARRRGVSEKRSSRGA